MRGWRLLWRVYPPFLLITLLALFGTTWYASRSHRSYERERRLEELKVRTRLVEARFSETGLNPEQVEPLCRELSTTSSTRVTVVLSSGEVIGDTHQDYRTMGNHRDRPEIARVLEGAGATGNAVRYSKTLGQEMMYVALPLVREGEVLAVLRSALPMTDIEAQGEPLYMRFLMGGLLIAGAAALAALWVARRISRPLEEIRRGAERFARGDLEGRIDVPRTLEIGILAETLNHMARQLDEKINTILRQSNAQAAIVESMAEGVLAVDAAHNVLNLNGAAARMIATDIESAQGRDVRSVIRNIDLLTFVDRALEAEDPLECDIELRDGNNTRLQVHGTPLRDAHGQTVGAVVVLSDVTRLQRLEEVRRDFVANVSHELRTPITSIKGFVETLTEGAKDNPDTLERFLGILQRQSDRMASIVDDLLTLCRLEEEESLDLPREIQAVSDVLTAAVEICSTRVEGRGMQVKVDCDPKLVAEFNAPLMEQAIINLVDNAINYSDDGGCVDVVGREEDGKILVSVKDRGAGISSEHLPRLFERFYRVDKARSRELGGTGLGLAIVKHIAQVHRGQVTVDSVVSVGSTFTVEFPAAAEQPD